jgi:hypothetical protein
MRTSGEIKRLKSSSRRRSRRGAAKRSADVPPELIVRDLRRIGSRLRAGARDVLREYLVGLTRMGLDTVESVAYLSCAFLNAMLEEAPGVRAELTNQLERFIRGGTLETTAERGGRGSSPSGAIRRRGEGERRPADAPAERGRTRRGRA